MTDPIAVLREFHREIETTLPVLIRLSNSAAGDALTGKEKESVEQALSFFRDVVPQHAADEEESVFPRLRQEKTSMLLPVLARIESLEEEHVCADRIHAKVEQLCEIWLRRGMLWAPEVSRLANLLAGLRDVYRHHIAIEENEVFPAAASTFSESTLQAVAGEMAGRRRSSKSNWAPL